MPGASPLPESPPPETLPVGSLVGVGVGPGDPDLLTRKAIRTLLAVDVIAYFAARNRPGNAWQTITPILAERSRAAQEIRLEFPVTTEAVDPGEYERLLSAFFDGAASRIARLLDEGHQVAVICEGDPLLYGSYMYLHRRLSTRYEATVIPGITSIVAAAAVAAVPLVSAAETLAIVPGTVPPDKLAATLATADAAVIMKVGRHLDAIRAAADHAGVLDRAVYVERATWPEQIVVPLADTGDVAAPYSSIVLIPGLAVEERWQQRSTPPALSEVPPPRETPSPREASSPREP